MSSERFQELEKLIEEALQIITESEKEIQACESPKKRRSLRQDIEDSKALIIKFESEIREIKNGLSNSNDKKERLSLPSANGTGGFPEEAELERKKTELSEYEGKLVKTELDLTTLKVELAEFEKEYLIKVGVKYLELDEAQAQFLEELARKNPDDLDHVRKARSAREEANTTAQRMSGIDLDEKNSLVKIQENHKRLYYQLAKLYHPDLAVNDEDRTSRTKIMTQVNQAYSRGDMHELNKILKNWEKSPEAIKGSDIASELERIERKISQIKGRLTEIEHEIQALKNSNQYNLMVQVNSAHSEGRDLLSEMAQALDEKILDLKSRANIKTKE